MVRTISVCFPIRVLRGYGFFMTTADCKFPKKVLVLAYVISPYRGSEYSVAWNFVTKMSSFCELTVLFGASGPNMGDTEELEDYLAQHQLPNVNFVAIKPNFLANCFNALNRRGWFTFTFYFAFHLWHRQVYKVATELLFKQSFDVVHYLGPIGYREPGYLWRLGLPYVWGPIGGANNIPRQLFAALPMAGKIKFIGRNAMNWFQLRFSRRLHNSLKHTNILLTATTENQNIFRSVLRKESMYLPENGIVGEIRLNREKFASFDKIHLVWIGSIEARKGLKILVDALSKSQHSLDFLVHVVGEGPLRADLELKVCKAGLDGSFIWHGQVSRDKVQELLSFCHLHVITSVSEANTTVIWEAMACGVPTLTIDHCGMHDTVTNTTGIKIPVVDYQQVVDLFACRLDELAEQPIKLLDMAEGIIKYAPRYHWDLRPTFFLERYEEAIQIWKDEKCHLNFFNKSN